jgi:protein-disulfide isomerase
MGHPTPTCKIWQTASNRTKSGHNPPFVGFRPTAGGQRGARTIEFHGASFYTRRAMKALSLFVILSVGFFHASCEKKDGADVTKDVPNVTLEGVDTSALTAREKREWSGYVSKLDAPCAGAGTVASCVTEKKNCAACTPAAKYVLKSVRDGMTNEQVEKAYNNRFKAEKARDVRLEDSPAKTSAKGDAPITVVEFADFECPHCAMMEPILTKLYAQFGADARFVFKFMPLPLHTHGEISARAGFAAHRQGKFWEMHDKMFKNQSHLEETNLMDYAKELGLDVEKFRTDMTGAEATDRIAKDKKLATDLDVGGTPTIYINGRLVDLGANPEQTLTDWINLEFVLRGVTPHAAPTAVPIASASALLDAGKSAAPSKDAGAAK